MCLEHGGDDMACSITMPENRLPKKSVNYYLIDLKDALRSTVFPQKPCF